VIRSSNDDGFNSLYPSTQVVDRPEAQLGASRGSRPCLVAAIAVTLGAGGNDVSGSLMLARFIEPTSKEDDVRVLDQVGVAATSCPTINRCLPGYADARGVSGSPRRARSAQRWARVLVM
jgi:hypothetical protein